MKTPTLSRNMADSQVDYAAVAVAYAEGAVADAKGERHCKWVRLACQRHLDDLARADSEPAWPYLFSPEHVAENCSFIERMPHVEGEWVSPTIVLEPWQTFVQANIFGWRSILPGRYSTLMVSLVFRMAWRCCAACWNDIGIPYTPSLIRARKTIRPSA